MLLNVPFTEAPGRRVIARFFSRLNGSLPAAAALVLLASAVAYAKPKTHSISLTWKASISRVRVYRVYRALDSSGPFALVGSAPGSTTRYTDKMVEPGGTYFYKVTAVDIDQRESPPTAEISATIPQK